MKNNIINNKTKEEKTMRNLLKRDTLKDKIFITLMAAITSFAILILPNFITPADAVNPTPKVTVNGEYVTFTDQKPFIDSNNRTMVPVRAPMEAIGCTVDWDADKRQAIIAKGETKAVFTIDSKTYTVNGQNKTMDTQAVIVNSRTAFPIRFAAEAMGATVGWDANTYTVIITTGQQVKPPVTSEKIEGTPFYQATPEQIQACKNGKMPNFTTVGFDGMSKAALDVHYDNWDFVFNNLPYKFYTDKSLVYMAQGEPVFRGYIDMGNGLKMVDLMFGSNLVAIVDTDTVKRLELVRW